MLPSSELQEILKVYAEKQDVDLDIEQLANFITHKTYGFLRAQRPNLGALLIAGCAVIDTAMREKEFNVSISYDNEGNVEVQRDDTDECVVSQTLIEAIIHFADELEP